MENRHLTKHHRGIESIKQFSSNDAAERKETDVQIKCPYPAKHIQMIAASSSSAINVLYRLH